jgi:hypothetical protein
VPAARAREMHSRSGRFCRCLPVMTPPPSVPTPGSELEARRQATRSLPGACDPAAGPRGGRSDAKRHPAQDRAVGQRADPASGALRPPRAVPPLGRPAIGTAPVPPSPGQTRPPALHLVVCAWCHALVRRLASAGRPGPVPVRVSHGICPRCRRAQLAVRLST